jgi:methenyltetrahydromethanopterin cyclohydrolase
MHLNQGAARVCRRMTEAAEALRVAVHRTPEGAQIVDCGIAVPGGLEAGRLMAAAAMAGLGDIQFYPPSPAWPWLQLGVRTDHPIAACMAAQYAGWQISVEKYFAMGSGPMRAVAGKEDLFATIGHREEGQVAVGVLESCQLPPAEVCRHIASQCRIEPSGLILLVAPTGSQAGTVQIVARSVETAMHKLHELGFDLSRIESGFGVAPLPPVAKTDLAAMGRTNDAILYGAEVTLWVRGDDDSIRSIGRQVPSETSADHGQPFVHIFQRYGRDFYRIDPGLFAPAVVSFLNLDSGNSFRFGRTVPEVVEASFKS